ncbi:MAG TPA: TCP-1/cpn60 chaperonin family protein [Bacillota bacterium]|nr:TCP-1/cpn60 chaperonin family protein [Bacillota bacterium]
MSRSGDGSHPYIDERLNTLMNNVNAVRAISSAVEGTLGPKGLDTMLVDEHGQVIITNDGVTILEQMEVKHPAARMLIKIASAQQAKVGDGTTTATVLASALVQEGAAQVEKGVPIVQVIAGIQRGVEQGLAVLSELARKIDDLDDPLIDRVAYIAARENESIARLVTEGAKLAGMDQLLTPDWRLSDSIQAYEGEESEVFQGVLLNRLPVSRHMPRLIENPRILVLEDGLGPEGIDDEALGTEIGFRRFLENKEEFKQNLGKLDGLGINVVVCEYSCDPLAEEFCTDHGIVLIHRVSKQEMRRLAEHVSAKPIKRTGLLKSPIDLQVYIGGANLLLVDDRSEKVRIQEGMGKPTATILVGAATAEIVGEKGRIAGDAASSVQAAIKSGIVSGGGSTEIAIASKIEEWRSQIQGMVGYGIDAVIAALQKPFSQMVINAGYNPFEKIEAVKSAQRSEDCSSLGLDFNTGEVKDMMDLGVIDPTLVKYYALKAAGEIAVSILRIHTIIRMRPVSIDQE